MDDIPSICESVSRENIRTFNYITPYNSNRAVDSTMITRITDWYEFFDKLIGEGYDVTRKTKSYPRY